MKHMLTKKLNLLLLPGLLLGLAISSSAQVGSMQGKVTDESGEPIGGATIKIERTDVKASYEVKTHKKKGTYMHAGLPMGTYTVSLLIDDEVIDRVAGVRVGMGSNKPVDFDLAEVKKRQAKAQKAGGPSKDVLASMSPAERKKYQADLEKRQKQMAKNKNLNEAFNGGMEAARAGDFATAVTQLTKASELDPEQDVVWANLADSQVSLAKTKTGDEKAQLLAGATASYRKALDLKPTEAAYYNNLGLALIQAGENEEGQALLAQAAEMDPANGGRYYFNLGAVMINSGNTQGAIEAFRNAVEKQPDYAEAYYQLGIALSGKAELNADGSVVAPPGLIEALQKYLELTPEGPNALGAQAMIQSMSGAVETTFEDTTKKKKKKS